MMDTPRYIFKEEEFKNNIEAFKEALTTYFIDAEVGYSVKTNSLPYIVSKAYSLGCMIEVTSSDEFKLAVKMGVPVSRIIYNGPSKDLSTFIQAVDNGAIVNIENFRELEWLSQCKKGMGVGLRLNVNLGLISKEDTKDNEEASRFGLSYENGDFERAINKVTDSGLILKGLHVHRTSKTRSVNVYSNMAKYIKKIVDGFSLELEYIDIGGGFWGGVPGKPSFIDYSKAIRNEINGLSKVKIIVEPGSAAIASSVDFEMEIIDTKLIEGINICTVNGSRIDVDPFFHKTSYEYEIKRNSINLNLDKEVETDKADKQRIAGCTCLESDIMFNLDNKRKLKTGDVITLKKVGAYTMTLTPNFIRTIPSVYVQKKDGNLELVRKKWSVEEWTQKCFY